MLGTNFQGDLNRLPYVWKQVLTAITVTNFVIFRASQGTIDVIVNNARTITATYSGAASRGFELKFDDSGIKGKNIARLEVKSGDKNWQIVNDNRAQWRGTTATPTQSAFQIVVTFVKDFDKCTYTNFAIDDKWYFTALDLYIHPDRGTMCPP